MNNDIGDKKFTRESEYYREQIAIMQVKNRICVNHIKLRIAQNRILLQMNRMY